MDSDDLNRIALVVTIMGCLYMFALLTLQYGWVGLLGTALSLFLIATALVLWSKFRSD